jgi:aromatic ring-opening dioxygenase catalytic subunit (LigB family)
MTRSRLPTLFIPHGGGPCFFMAPGDVQPPSIWDGMAAHLRGLAASVGPRPSAILVVSGHWETQIPTVNAASDHSLYYDYYNFPPHTYRLQYPAPGAPAVAERTRALLKEAGIESASDTARGLDHGVFIPLKLVYPEADIPIVQLSLQADLSPQAHLAIGRAIAPLRDEGVLIIGSGMSFHNMSAFRGPPGRFVDAAKAFDTWLTEAVEAPPAARDAALAHWAGAPGARIAHPREEHLLPLMVAAGAAGDDAGARIYGEPLGGAMALSGYRFG